MHRPRRRPAGPRRRGPGDPTTPSPRPATPPPALPALSAPLPLPVAFPFSPLPVVGLGRDLPCRFTPGGAGRELWLVLHRLYVILGTALSAVVVLTLTGVLRDD